MQDEREKLKAELDIANVEKTKFKDQLQVSQSNYMQLKEEIWDLQEKGRMATNELLNSLKV